MDSSGRIYADSPERVPEDDRRRLQEHGDEIARPTAERMDERERVERERTGSPEVRA